MPPIAQWSWPSRNRGRDLTCQCPAGYVRTNRWQVEDTTLRLAGGDLGDRAKQPSALSRTLSRTLTRALNITVTTVRVIAGQVKIRSRHSCGTTGGLWSPARFFKLLSH